MSYTLIVRKRAESHIEKAFEWYEHKRKNLGNDFLQAIEEALNTIELNPESFQLKYKNIRAIYTKRFPYGIFYTIDKNKIIVLAVFHLSQNPKLWHKLSE